MNDIIFLRPQLLWLLLTPLFLLIAELVLHLKKRRNLCIHPEMRAYLMKPSNNSLKLIFRVLPVLGLSIGVIALAGPAKEHHANDDKNIEKTLSLVVHIPDDISTSELNRMKISVYQLLDSLHDERVSLLVQGGSAHTIIPFTKDHRLIRNYVSYLSPRIMPAKGDDLARIATVIKNPEDHSYHSVIYITPSLTTSKWEIWKDIDLDADDKFMLLTTENCPLQDSTLFSLGADSRGVSDLIARINSNAQTKDRKVKLSDSTLWADKGPVVCIPAMLLLLFLFVKRKNALLVVVCCIGLSSCDYSIRMASEAKTNYYLLKGDTIKAIDASPNAFQRGQLCLEVHDIKRAATEFALDTTSEARYNQGLALLSNGRFVESLSAFQEVKQQQPEWSFVNDNIRIIQDYLLYREQKKETSKKNNADTDSDSFEKSGDDNGLLDFEIWADKLENESGNELRRRNESTNRKSELIFQQIENNNEEFLKKRLQHEYSHQGNQATMD